MHHKWPKKENKWAKSHQTRMFLKETTDEQEGTPPRYTALENDFPSAAISKVATLESWRKEIHAPASHTHKWWAQRLSSVLRAVIIAAYSKNSNETLQRINSGLNLKNVRILDPFAGSGTTLVEALKLGASCAGVDINPVANLVQRQALQKWNKGKLFALFQEVERSCRNEIDSLYIDANGHPVLYYFWVAQVDCPTCSLTTDLFSDYTFAKHTSHAQHPIAHTICPECDSIEQVDLSENLKRFCVNGHSLDRVPPVSGQNMQCKQGHKTRIVDALAGEPPKYRMYAKLVLDNALKRYSMIDDFDIQLYEKAEQKLAEAEDLLRPLGSLEWGHNTRQAIRWGFTRWEQFFNTRQLYCLGILGKAIRELEDPAEREALCTLFSGILEFNNLFCSFKGEGTGAVRHMFSHHILKPGRTPLEAHPWGTSKSSGSFSTLFKSRIIRAHNYKTDPHDIILQGHETKRRKGISYPLNNSISDWEVINSDAAVLPYKDDFFDLVVTDPPYFNKVHYSELADFFHAWLKELRPFTGYETERTTTRSSDEVQDTDVAKFGDGLMKVFKESARVLKKEGLLIFSFHHESIDVWKEVVRSLQAAELVITSIQPVKAEMSTSTPKNSAKEPSNLDSMIVCRPCSNVDTQSLLTSPKAAAKVAIGRLRSLSNGGIKVSRGDVRSVVTGSIMALATLPTSSIDDDRFVALAERLTESACREWGELAPPI